MKLGKGLGMEWWLLRVHKRVNISWSFIVRGGSFVRGLACIDPVLQKTAACMVYC